MRPYYVAFDLETTGLFAASDRIIEIGAVKFEPSGLEVSRFESLVRPDWPISPGANRVHGLEAADLRDAPPIGLVLAAFLEWLGPTDGVVLLAHHARFDASFLGAEAARHGWVFPAFTIVDTLALARFRLPRAFNHKLNTLVGLLGLGEEGHDHRAMGDCLRVRGLWLALDGENGPRMEYRPFDPATEEPAPLGWESMVEAIARGHAVSMRYRGGSRGPEPRTITPRRIYHQGGTAYLAAYCHLGGFEKVFRLERIECFELKVNTQAEPVPTKGPAGRKRRSG